MNRKNLMRWAYKISTNSPDGSTQNGAIIATDSDNGSLLVHGHNDFTNGFNPTENEKQRPLKYYFTEHAERNAIYNAAKGGVNLDGTTMFAPWSACTDCARAIVQSGIICLVRHKDAMDESVSERWDKDLPIADRILIAGGVVIIEMEGKIMEDDFFVRFNGELWSP